MLPLGLFFEQIQERSHTLSDALLDLDVFWTTAPVDFHYFLFLADLLSDEKLKDETRDLSVRFASNRTRAQELSKCLGIFRETVIEQFFERAGKIADLEHQGTRSTSLAIPSASRWPVPTSSASSSTSPSPTDARTYYFFAREEVLKSYFNAKISRYSLGAYRDFFYLCPRKIKNSITIQFYAS